MDARFFTCGLILCLPLAAVSNEPITGNLRTRNFVVTAPDQQLASQVGFAAEKYRRDLAKEWLGKEIPDWPQPCMITVQVNQQAFGETSFSFATGVGRQSQPFDFVMKVNGSRERILDSVLPHEISHTIFATHFGQPLPRWADEGACTTVEHISERRKNHQMLIEFLTTKRGIPFNKMFALKQYPRDILPLYAQGYSLCRFFIQRGGKRKFIQFMGDGLASSNWNAAVAKYYQIKDLSVLQSEWLVWIKAGCPKPAQSGNSQMVSTLPDKRAPSTNSVAPSNNLLASNSASQSRQSRKSLPIQSRVDPSGMERSGMEQDSKQNRSLNEFPNQDSTTGQSLEPRRTATSSQNFYLSEIERIKSRTLIR